MTSDQPPVRAVADDAGVTFSLAQLRADAGQVEAATRAVRLAAQQRIADEVIRKWSDQPAGGRVEGERPGE